MNVSTGQAKRGVVSRLLKDSFICVHLVQYHHINIFLVSYHPFIKTIISPMNAPSTMNSSALPELYAWGLIEHLTILYFIVLQLTRSVRGKLSEGG